MTTPHIVSHEEWLKARQARLAREKAFGRPRDALARSGPVLWEKVEKGYVFDAPEGKVTLADLFAGKSRLVVRHFMFGLDSNEGCPSCSSWIDNFNGIDVHLARPDTAFVLVAHRPIARIEAYRKRMGWTVRWVSSLNNDFNFDYGVSFQPCGQPDGEETPGLCVFRKGDDGAIYRSCSTSARDLEDPDRVLGVAS